MNAFLRENIRERSIFGLFPPFFLFLSPDVLIIQFVMCGPRGLSHMHSHIYANLFMSETFSGGINEENCIYCAQK